MAPKSVLLLLSLSLSIFPFSSLASPARSGWDNWDNDTPVAKTDAGTVIGFTTTASASGRKLNTFLGVPFGAQPVRFAAPHLPTPWTEPFDASSFGPACVQQFNYPEARRNLIMEWFNTPPPPAGESEDCLNLNIYVPLPMKEPKAVMVWIYGGGLLYGSNAAYLYNASNLAANEDVIVVVINYRTNVFGFPGGVSELPPTERNLGFLDQRLALDWVQRNIAAFGGDPTRVTIFGESAGGTSVDALVLTPPNPLPFHAAIMESGTATVRPRPADPAAQWKILIAGVNCSDSSDVLACMRALPAETIVAFNQVNRTSWGPVFDNVTLSETARSDRLTSKPGNSKIARVPILGGSNADEGRLYSYGATNATAFILGLFPTATADEVTALLAAYPLSEEPEAEFTNEFERLAAVYTDVIFQCPARLVHLETAQVGIPSYRYYYNASFAGSDIFPDAGVYHASEIGIVFGSYNASAATSFEHRFSAFVQKVWADFAKDPTGSGVPPWPRGAEGMGELGGGVRVEDGPDAEGALFTPLDAQQMDEVDRRCALYQAIYDAWSR